MTNRWKRVLLSLLTAASLNVSILHIYAEESEEVPEETTTEEAVEETEDETIEEITEKPAEEMTEEAPEITVEEAEETEEIIEVIPESIGEEPEKAEEITEEVIEYTSEDDYPTEDWQKDTVTYTGSLGDGLTWEYEAEGYAPGYLWIKGNGKLPDYTQSTMESRPWNDFHDDIIHVILEQGVQSVGNYAFADCSSLTNVSMSKTVVSIGNNAFAGCTSLNGVHFSDLITSIGDSAFEGCASLKFFEIPSYLTSIGNSAFRDCMAIETLRIPGGVTAIGDYAFYNCGALRYVYLEEGVSEVGEYAFHHCDSLMTVELPLSIKILKHYAFNGDKKLKTVYYHGPRTSWMNVQGIVALIALANIVFPEYGTGIARIYGDDRYATSREVAFNFWGKTESRINESVIIASGTNFADALAGGYLAYKKDAPILLVNGKSKSTMDKVAEYIDSKCAIQTNVYILGGPEAVPDYMISKIKESGGYQITRIGGKNRYETNLMILEEAGVSKEDILIADGTSFADSLSASATKRPILLVGKKGLNNDQKTFLNAHKGNMHYILGGTNAVSKSVEEVVRSYGTVGRIEGKSRYETSQAIAYLFNRNSKSVVLAYGSKFPDGLSGGPLAISLNAPLVLVKPGNEQAASDYCDWLNIHLAYVLGGDTLIPSDTVRNILHLDYSY